MTTDLLKEALHGVADRAVRPEGLAEKALRRAARRRATMIGSVAAGTVAAVVLPAVLLTGAPSGRQPALERPAVEPAATTTAADCGAGRDFRTLVARETSMGPKLLLLGAGSRMSLCVQDDLGPSPVQGVVPRLGLGDRTLMNVATLRRVYDRPGLGKVEVQLAYGAVAPKIKKVVVQFTVPAGKGTDPRRVRDVASISRENGVFVGGLYSVLLEGVADHLGTEFEVIGFDARSKILWRTTIPGR